MRSLLGGVARCVLASSLSPSFASPLRVTLTHNPFTTLMFGIKQGIEAKEDFLNLSRSEQKSHIIGMVKRWGKTKGGNRLENIGVKLGHVDFRRHATFMSAIGPNGEYIEAP